MPRVSSKKELVVAAALSLFRQKGIRATTTKDIARRAGVSEGTIYRHFASKDELAAYIFERTETLFFRFLSSWLPASGDATDMLRQYIRGFFAFSRKHHKHYSFIVAAYQTELRKSVQSRMKPQTMLERIIRHGQVQGSFRLMDTRLASAMVLGVLIQTVFHLKTGQLAVNFSDVLLETEQTCLRILQNGARHHPEQPNEEADI